jgi:hypothetical protein
MKNLTAIWLLFSYLLLSTGVNIPVHVCKMTGKVSFSQAGGNCCGNTEKSCPVKKKTCCEDKILTLKIKNSHKLQATTLTKALVQTAISHSVQFPDWYALQESYYASPVFLIYSLPPPKIPVYLKNEALII